MKIAVIGAGYVGLSCAYQLLKLGHLVSIFEKDQTPGGLASGFMEKNWSWHLEKHYHHFFTNDTDLINLTKELGLESHLIFPQSQTATFLQSKIYPFNTPKDILSFSPLAIFDRLRLGLITVLLKMLPQNIAGFLEKFKACDMAKLLYGKNVYRLIWEPLLAKKFHEYKTEVNAAWLWARIKKRTLRLGYFTGGFQVLTNALVKKITSMKGGIFLNRQIDSVSQLGEKIQLEFSDKTKEDFEIVISTVPSVIFAKIVKDLPLDYLHRINSIPHLHAINLIVQTDGPILKEIYWLNINNKDFPFLCAVQHTNFIDKKNYNGHHLLYVSNYLPDNHQYLQKTASELWEIYLPYLKKISPDLKFKIKNIKLFTAPFAQPVFLPNYIKIRPFGKTPLKNLYFANLDSVYPWDRGTNYALELGKKIAILATESHN